MIEDFALMDILLAESFPKEVNKSKIKDIFEILQSQERPDLAQELKKLLLFKSIRKDGSKSDDESNAVDLPLVNKVLPTEMLKKILENLDCKSLCNAKHAFKRWKDIIDEFRFVEKSLGKILEFHLVHFLKFNDRIDSVSFVIFHFNNFLF